MLLIIDGKNIQVKTGHEGTRGLKIIFHKKNGLGPKLTCLKRRMKSIFDSLFRGYENA